MAAARTWQSIGRESVRESQSLTAKDFVFVQLVVM